MPATPRRTRDAHAPDKTRQTPHRQAAFFPQRGKTADPGRTRDRERRGSPPAGGEVRRVARRDLRGRADALLRAGALPDAAKAGRRLSATEDARQKTVLDLLPPALRRQGYFRSGDWTRTRRPAAADEDGDLAHRITHPRQHVPKVYRAAVDGVLTEGTPRPSPPVSSWRTARPAPGEAELCGPSVGVVTVFEGSTFRSNGCSRPRQARHGAAAHPDRRPAADPARRRALTGPCVQRSWSRFSSGNPICENDEDFFAISHFRGCFSPAPAKSTKNFHFCSWTYRQNQKNPKIFQFSIEICTELIYYVMYAALCDLSRRCVE